MFQNVMNMSYSVICLVYFGGSGCLLLFGPYTDILVIVSLIIEKIESFTHTHMFTYSSRVYWPCVCLGLCTICPILIVIRQFWYIIAYLNCRTVNQKILVIYTLFGLNLTTQFIYMYITLFIARDCFNISVSGRVHTVLYAIYGTCISWQETNKYFVYI